MEEHDGGRVGQLGVADPWTGELAAGPWEKPLPLPGPASEPSVGAAGPADASIAAGSAAKSAAGAAEWPTRAWGPAAGGKGAAERAAVYRDVREGEAFQEVRRRYRRFAFPASAAFFVWYLAYVVAATTLPGLMARRLVGPVNVAMAAGLAQFVTTFALTWAYAWHARRWRDRAALDVRWETQERIR